MGDNVSTFYDAMERLERERLRGLEFDTFVLFDAHWFTTLDYVINAHSGCRAFIPRRNCPRCCMRCRMIMPAIPSWPVRSKGRRGRARCTRWRAPIATCRFIIRR